MKRTCSIYRCGSENFYIIPMAKAKDVPVWVAVCPTQQVDSNTGDEELGEAIQRAFAISASYDIPKFKEARINEYWKELGYKKYGAFSKKYSSIELKSDGEKVSLIKMIRDSHGAYEPSKDEVDTKVLDGTVSAVEIANTVKEMFSN